MHRQLNPLILSLSAILLCGCSSKINRTLSPPADTKWVNVEIKNPSPYTKPFPLEVKYISHQCLKKRVSGFDGSVITEPSYNAIQIPLQQQSGDIWQGKVARVGGGKCKWTLSAVTLGIEYIEATHLGKDLVLGTAVGVTLEFDDNKYRNQWLKSVEGNLHLSPKYYPYIKEKKIDKIENSVSLFGKDDFLSLRAKNLRKITYNPLIDESKITKLIGNEKKIKGVYPKIIYPDGSIAPERTLFPNFDKVDRMKVK